MKKLCICLLTCISFIETQADVRLPRLISDGMVLQRDQPLKIWGWAAPGEKVTVQLRKQQYPTVTNAAGSWQVQLPAQRSGGPVEIQINGNNRITLRNVVFGDVWVCSGQSNMELEMNRVKYRYAADIAAANFPMIRQFTVPRRYDFKAPQADVVDGSWVAASPATIGRFSAVAFFFARELHRRHNIPIGIINSALGGSPAEAWISEEGLQPFPAYLQEAHRYRNDELIRETENHDQRISNAWYNYINTFDAGYSGNWKAATGKENGWQHLQVPGYWADSDAGFFNGVVWFHKAIEVPDRMTKQPVKLELGRIVDADSVFINGKFAGWTSYQYPPRRYELPAGLLQPGTNHIVIRVVNSSGKGGFVPDKRYELTSASDTVALAGTWNFRIGIKATALPDQTFIRWKPMGLYNAMIAPLTNYAIKGVLWYQGESNAGRPGDYLQLMQALIADWRSKWAMPQLPFLQVQLANFMEPQNEPRESSWAQLRQQQLRTLQVPHTGMAVAIDAGEWNDIHPEDKYTIGYRLSLLARRMVYGENRLVASGPLYERMEIKGNKIVLHFRESGSGLATCDGKAVQHIAIAGADKNFVWAQAIIRGNTLEVWSNSVPQPAYVRYAWADNPLGANLCNREGLPASPFTTEQ